MTESNLSRRTIDVVRGLSMDAPQAANSGHPGTAMALAPLALVLWERIMTYDASAPDWPDRDRLVLSGGHASILLYSYLFLTGHGLELDDLRAFRQWGSSTPGHPELGHTAGVEVTTGPLGQGLANAVGLAMAEAHQRATLGDDVVDHHTFVICGDGDLAEGVSHEAASLAGHLGLGRLIAVYDDNHISIDGPTELALSDDAAARFAAYGWHVEDCGEIAEDLDALEAALRRAMAVSDRPSLVIIRSHIGFPSPTYTDTAFAHGNPLGVEEISATRSLMGLPDEAFWVPEDVLTHMRDVGLRGRRERERWQERFDARRSEPVVRAAFEGGVPEDAFDDLPRWEVGTSIATRNAGKKVLNGLIDRIPGLIGGGADLTGNTGTELDGAVAFSRHTPEGRQIFFGVREHAMGAAMNGLAAHGGLLPFGGTFFVFSDYMRPAVRLAALCGLHVIYSWTHDSVGLGEDGPTHQPIEHLASLRAMPGLRLLRPADANETAQAWRIAIERPGPTALILSRQNLPVLAGTEDGAVVRGAYVLRDPSSGPDVVLLGTGSEVALCVEAADLLAEDGVAARVVSMPSWELFDEQDEDYRDSVLPRGVPVVSVEAGTTFGWSRWATTSVGIDRFGASAPGAELLDRLGINVGNILGHVRAVLD